VRLSHFIYATALLAAAALSGCLPAGTTAQNTSHSDHGNHNAVNIPSGTALDVTLATPLTSETAQVGNGWSGSIQNPSMGDGRNAIPTGSLATGTVIGVTPAHQGNRAMLDLGLSSITIEGRNYRVQGNAQAVIAGSTRARNLGAIGASTVAGAVVGHAIGGSREGTLAGALVGAGVATGVVSQTKGWQVVLKPGTPITFTTTQAVAVRI